MEAREEYGHEILKLMLEVEDKPVYFKDMAYHVAGFMSRSSSQGSRTRSLSASLRGDRFAKQVLADFTWKRPATNSSTGCSGSPWRTERIPP